MLSKVTSTLADSTSSSPRRTIPGHVLAGHYTGEAARQRRRGEIATRLAELHGQLVRAAEEPSWLNEVVGLLDRARAGARRLPGRVRRADGLASLKLQARRLAEQREKLDRSEIGELEQARNEISRRRSGLETERDEGQRRIGEAEERIRTLEARLGEARHQTTPGEGGTGRVVEAIWAST